MEKQTACVPCVRLDYRLPCCHWSCWTWSWIMLIIVCEDSLFLTHHIFALGTLPFWISLLACSSVLDCQYVHPCMPGIKPPPACWLSADVQTWSAGQRNTLVCFNEHAVGEMHAMSVSLSKEAALQSRHCILYSIAVADGSSSGSSILTCISLLISSDPAAAAW